MQIYPGADLIECEIVGRPLYLPVLREGSSTLLLDCGTRHHAAEDIPSFLDRLGVAGLDWLVVTHPDGDHCGGTGVIKERYPQLQIFCGEADRRLVECPDYLFDFRYDAYRREHGIFFDPQTAAEIRDCFSGPQSVLMTLVGGETIRLGSDRILEIWHLPGHSHGHLGIYDRKHRALYYGDAIQGAGYRSLKGGWALCPTYLYVDAYWQTISTIENSPVETIVGCHWPVLYGKTAIREFCAESRNFVLLADRLITDYLSRNPSGANLRELCENLSPQLGEWPHSVHLELANALSGHLDRGVLQGRLDVHRSEHPFRYRLCRN
jgi:glyoxylase-like metal-dependent hydrolase (beta-lactamase superfamily II)